MILKRPTWTVNPVSKLINEGIKTKVIVATHYASSQESNIKEIWMKMVQKNKQNAQNFTQMGTA